MVVRGDAMIFLSSVSASPHLFKPKSIIDIAVDLKISVNEFLWLNPNLKMPTGTKPFRERMKNFVLSPGTYTFKVPKTP